MNTIAKLSFAALLGLGLVTEIRAQEWSATVDGVTAYFGVVRSEFARDMLSVHGATDRDGHGRPRPRSDDHHVLIAIFDAASGQRIPHALISASHDSGSGVDQRRALEAMTFGDAVTFGKGSSHPGGRCRSKPQSARTRPPMSASSTTSSPEAVAIELELAESMDRAREERVRAMVEARLSRMDMLAARLVSGDVAVSEQRGESHERGTERMLQAAGVKDGRQGHRRIVLQGGDGDCDERRAAKVADAHQTLRLRG